MRPGAAAATACCLETLLPEDKAEFFLKTESKSCEKMIEIHIQCINALSRELLEFGAPSFSAYEN